MPDAWAVTYESCIKDVMEHPRVIEFIMQFQATMKRTIVEHFWTMLEDGKNTKVIGDIGQFVKGDRTAIEEFWTLDDTREMLDARAEQARSMARICKVLQDQVRAYYGVARPLDKFDFS